MFIYHYRSVTPTELGRRRHLSSTGSIEIDWSDPIQHLNEIDIPRYYLKKKKHTFHFYMKI